MGRSKGLKFGPGPSATLRRHWYILLTYLLTLPTPANSRCPLPSPSPSSAIQSSIDLANRTYWKAMKSVHQRITVGLARRSTSVMTDEWKWRGRGTRNRTYRKPFTSAVCASLAGNPGPSIPPEKIEFGPGV